MGSIQYCMNVNDKQSKDLKEQSKNDDHVNVSKALSSSSGTRKLDRLGRTPSQNHPPVPSIYSLLSFQGTDAEKLLRKELLNSRSQRKLDDWKHFYIVSTGNVLSTAETTIGISRIPGGTALTTRTTNAVKLHRTTGRIRVRRSITGIGSVSPLLPTISIVFWRDKIPAQPGTAPAVFATDAVVPASDTAVFSGLGSAIAPQLMVRNPNTTEDYHIYVRRHHYLGDQNYGFTTPGTPVGIATPHDWNFEFEIYYHEAQQQYATYSTTAACVNDIYFTYVQDTTTTNQGYTTTLDYTFDTEFRDVQD